MGEAAGFVEVCWAMAEAAPRTGSARPAERPADRNSRREVLELMKHLGVIWKSSTENEYESRRTGKDVTRITKAKARPKRSSLSDGDFGFEGVAIGANFQLTYPVA
jgi:hypothetical protein